MDQTITIMICSLQMEGILLKKWKLN